MSTSSLKRPHISLEDVDGEHVIDDLLFASAFAMIPNDDDNIHNATLGEGEEKMETTGKLAAADDDNAIDVEDDDEDDESEAGDAAEKQQHDVNKSDDETEEDEDDEDEDIAAAVAQMVATEKEEGDDDDPSTALPPKTENEVDGYKVPIHELEAMLQLQLSVDSNNKGIAGKSSSAAFWNSSLDRKLLSPAGTIKNFMVIDRTVVVESSARSSSSSPFQGPLDEGSLLVMEIPSSLVVMFNEQKDPTMIVPLGRIFEVFGPVSQPLYTIRLPSPLPNVEKKVNASPMEKVDADTTENSPAQDAEASTQEEPSMDKAKENETAEPSSPSVSTSAPAANDSPVLDPWAPDGVFTTYVRQNPNISVFYSQDEAKLIDTEHVLRNSGKGCDASNLFDEEVVNSNEMYYSDDEQEREAKNRQKGRGKGAGRMARNHHQREAPDRYSRGGGQAALPSGFHTMAPPPPPPGNYYPHQRSLPQGFHSMPPPPPPPPPQYNRAMGTSFPPPPGLQPPPHQRPPPPPPRNPNEPPAYQY